MGYEGPGIGRKVFNTQFGELYHQLETLCSLIIEYLYIYKSLRVYAALCFVWVALRIWKTIDRPRVIDNANRSYFI